MKKTKNNSRKKRPQKVLVTIEDGLQFIESFQKLLAEQDDKTVAISLRVPKNILSAIKFKALSEKKRYQSLIIEYLRLGLKSSENHTENHR